ncbi:Gfo/Idh/MocA family oxidoreductase [Kibdelosporangium persicum]|uniref:Glycosyl hydrolase family 109 protein n=1 Tax=Kibdelosporangium persicum TaxID=2698649 RepID=A0ABX2F4Z2_9PSEU|nr:Gfo/Idh/MocA family oxidoreductase [Kibdelosporangium persicum]NRN65880.1 Twin-arginine translocation pathway signal [Kibdelosporangium persicum]
MSDQVSRRSLLAAGAALGLGSGAQAEAQAQEDQQDWPRQQGRSMIGVPFERHDTVRVAIIGLGNRGGGMIGSFLAVPGVKVTALCDVNADAAARAAKAVTDAGQPAPALYTKGEHDYENMLRRDDIDLVYVATPWEWHVPMALASVREGKHVGVETPFATSIDELWQLVDASERYQRHCMQLENCCYGRNEMRVLRMVHAGLFGELLHGAGAYNHDLRELLFSDTYYAGEWRRAWHTKNRLKGDLYPTHGLGPVAGYMDINRGDRIVRMSSYGTPALGLAEYRKAHEEPGDSSWRERYVESDMTISLLQTAKGRVIRLEHDVSTPHPYSRLNHIAGTKGVFEDYPPRIYLEPHNTGHQWADFEEYKSYDHWLWTDVPPGPGGHGGMDYYMVYRTIQTMRLGLVPDMDVYDGAVWSAPVPLSSKSIDQGGAPQQIPDFTRGRWRQSRPGVDSPKPA